MDVPGKNLRGLQVVYGTVSIKMAEKERCGKRAKVETLPRKESENDKVFNWSGLPLDIQREILFLVDFRDILRLRTVSKECRSLADWELERRAVAKIPLCPRQIETSQFSDNVLHTIELQSGWQKIFTQEDEISAKILQFFVEESHDGMRPGLCAMNVPIGYINSHEELEVQGITEQGDEVMYGFECTYDVDIDRRHAMGRVHWILSDLAKGMEHIRFPRHPSLDQKVIESCFGIILHARDLRFVGYKCRIDKEEGNLSTSARTSNFALLMTTPTGRRFQLTLKEIIASELEIVD